GEHGGGTAAPVAGQVLRKYFELKGVIKKPVAKEEDTAEDGPAEGDEE
ncbi:MAG: peptidoglycan glycosyltransferase, partial [Deltaproteobacteria bacterium]|nr:peptidoglycan glycosyltransferase [Deltaproteobacteria bacterium]